MMAEVQEIYILGKNVYKLQYCFDKLGQLICNQVNGDLLFLLWIGVIGTFLSQDSRLKRTGFYIIFIYILALFVMVVFRYDVGTDYLEYTDYYYRIHSLFELTSEDFFVEPGYVLLSSLLRSIGAPFELLSFILFLIIVCNLKRAIAFFQIIYLCQSYYMYFYSFYLSILT